MNSALEVVVRKLPLRLKSINSVILNLLRVFFSDVHQKTEDGE